MIMKKPLVLLTPREKEIRHLERAQAKLQVKVTQLYRKAVDDDELKHAQLLAETSALMGRAELNLHELRKEIHENVKRSRG